MAVEVEIDVEVLKCEIKKTYARVSEEPEEDFIFPTGRAWVLDLGYPPELVDRLPEAAAESFAGVANPFALGTLQRGEAVLDVGSGAGTDSLVAAQMVGADGTVTGLDMTPEMLRKARTAQPRWGQQTWPSSRERQKACRLRTGASTSSSRTGSSTWLPTRMRSSPRSIAFYALGVASRLLT
jgi:2-polyprenyl-3-methyl-5-hydroxy-6-metoxy-1,4-benzoquinol methylase